jgi:hypothetical protein
MSAGIRRSERGTLTERVLLLHLPLHLVRKVSSSDRHNGLHLDPLIDQREPGSGFVALVLTRAELRDIFSVLVSDLLEVVGPVPVPADQLRGFLQRLNRWQELLKSYVAEGLSLIARQGLYGELWTVRWLLDAGHLKPAAVVTAWTGPERSPQDFRFDRVMLEVKTTTGASPSLRIGGLWQLEPGPVDHLYLLHLPLSLSITEGETLPGLVMELVTRLASDQPVAALLEKRLLSAGYLHSQAAGYLTERWLVPGARLMAVDDTFPRLRADLIPAAVIAATYELDAASLQPWVCAPDSLFDLLEDHLI